MGTVTTNEINMKEDAKMERIIEMLGGACDQAFGVFENCKKLIDSRPGKLAMRLEDMSEAISDEKLREMGGQMKAFDGIHYYPVLANNVVPTWKHGYLQLYKRVDGGYQYETCALNGEVLNHNDERYNGYFISGENRDFVVVDLEYEAKEIINALLDVMEIAENK